MLHAAARGENDHLRHAEQRRVRRDRRPHDAPPRCSASAPRPASRDGTCGSTAARSCSPPLLAQIDGRPSSPAARSTRPATWPGPRRYLLRAFETQRAGAGFSFVEILTMCPTGWFVETDEAPDYLDETLAAVHDAGCAEGRARGDEHLGEAGHRPVIAVHGGKVGDRPGRRPRGWRCPAPTFVAVRAGTTVPTTAEVLVTLNDDRATIEARSAGGSGGSTCSAPGSTASPSRRSPAGRSPARRARRLRPSPSSCWPRMLAFEKRAARDLGQRAARAGGTRPPSGASRARRSASSASAPSAPDVAKRALAFDMEVLGLRRTDRPVTPPRRDGRRRTSPSCSHARTTWWSPRRPPPRPRHLLDDRPRSPR